MAEFRKWLEANPHGQFKFPHIKLVTRIDTEKMWVHQEPLYRGDHFRTYHCNNCGLIWQVPKGLGKPSNCPRCGSFDIEEISNG